DQLAEHLVSVLLHPDRLQVELHRPLVKNTHHDAFAVNHRNHGDADIDLAAGDLQLHAAVLRQPLFGDVQPRHDLQAADDGRLEAIDLRRHRLGLHHAVDAVADGDAVGLRLDVNVAGPQLDRFQQDFVDQANDRGFLGHLRQLGAVGLDVREQLNAVG